ncbi:MAG: hypothetical protein LBI67_05495 [Treponema sp.]|jgi:hypothetical protein|nr:hypothetical protein [Treponema sp.]
MAKPAKPEKILESLKKLYEKRAVLDKQILETEKSLVAATSVSPSGAVAAKKSSPRKGALVAKKLPVKK